MVTKPKFTVCDGPTKSGGGTIALTMEDGLRVQVDFEPDATLASLSEALIQELEKARGTVALSAKCTVWEAAIEFANRAHPVKHECRDAE